ncbi:TRAP transporter small permease subunit [Marivita sp.]|uniref:TRAP transporter small permease subunit n=1 Tax=Marivita sp. TaxID=2003365 RepID=UPI003F6F0584
MRLEERIARPIALAAGYVLLAQAIVTAIEIVSRKIFNHSLQGVDELGGYALAITATIGFGYAVITHAHTRIDLVIKRLPGAALAGLHMLAALVMLGVASGMLWFGIRTLRQSIRLGSTATTPLQTPLWIPQTLWVIGLVLFVVLSFVVVFRCAVLLARGDTRGIDAEMKAQSSEQQELDAAGISIDPTRKDK